MGSWLDRWAKRAATAAPVDDASTQIARTESEPKQASRRDFLKKAGIVGGVAWSIPVMQTVLAPSASASGPTVCSGPGGTCGTLVSGPGPCSPCANNVACNSNGDCANGICSGGFCGNPTGTTCTASGTCRYSNCFGGKCGGIGATCAGANTTTQCATNNGATVYCSPGGICGGTGGNTNGALCAPVGNNSNACVGGAECKSYGANNDRCK